MKNTQDDKVTLAASFTIYFCLGMAINLILRPGNPFGNKQERSLHAIGSPVLGFFAGGLACYGLQKQSIQPLGVGTGILAGSLIESTLEMAYALDQDSTDEGSNHISSHRM